MNLVAWILSLVVEWIRPLEPADPVLAAADADTLASIDEDLERDVAGFGPSEGARTVDGGAPEGIDPLADPLNDPLTDPLTDSLTVPIGSGLSASNPLWRLADRLLEWVAPAAAPAPGWVGWGLMLIVPALAIALLQQLFEGMGMLGGLLVLLLNVAVLYLAVPAGRLVRRLQSMAMLAAASEKAALRDLISRWLIDRPDPAIVHGRSGGRPTGEVAAATMMAPEPAGATSAAVRLGPAAADRLVFALPVIDGYRDVFAPLFWYVLLGPAAPIAYGFARLTAERREGLARRALLWIDWIPSRLAAASLAFAGRFDDAMLGLRAGHDAASLWQADSSMAPRPPVQALQLLLLPAAGGAIGVRLTDDAIEQSLRDASPEHEAPDAPPSPAAFAALRALLGRVGMIWGGLWLLAHLVG